MILTGRMCKLTNRHSSLCTAAEIEKIFINLPETELGTLIVFVLKAFINLRSGYLYFVNNTKVILHYKFILHVKNYFPYVTEHYASIVYKY